MLKRQLFLLVLQPLPSLVVLIAVGGGKYQRWDVVKSCGGRGDAEQGKGRKGKR